VSFVVLPCRESVKTPYIAARSASARQTTGALMQGVRVLKMDQGLKECSKCGRSKPLTEFYRMKASKDGRQAYCKACQGAVHKAYVSRPAVKTRLAAYMRDYRKRSKGS